MTGNSKLKAALIVVSVLMVVSTCVGGYLYWDMQGEKAKALETASIYQAEIAKALETASTYQAEIDKLSAKVQEQTDLVSEQSKLIDELKYKIDRQSEELLAANSLLDKLRSRDSMKSSNTSDGIIKLEPLDSSGSTGNIKGKQPIISGNGLTPEQNAKLQEILEAAGATSDNMTGHKSGVTQEEMQAEMDKIAGDEYH